MGKGKAHCYDCNKPVVEGKRAYKSPTAGGRYDLKARKVLVAAGRQ